MTLRHMKIFVSVCKEMSISLAAKKLFISQPAVSNSIKELETYYGTPLFDRISKKLYLTEAGKTVYHYAIQINTLFEELDATIKKEDGVSQLRIGSSITIGTQLIPDYIKDFSKRFPHIQTYVTIDSSDVIEKLVLENELDFALIEGMVHSDNIISKAFIKDELIIICDLKNPLLLKEYITVNDLRNQPFLMREKNSGTRELAESILSLHNIDLHPVWESSSTDAIIHGVLRGIGISVLPLQLVKHYLESKQLCQLKVQGLNFSRQYHIIYHKNKFLTNAVLEFIKLCGTLS